uniref:Uncharacterized protein n=1 Tax=Setaria italica TaxID=4555 RepID=K3Z1S4_SETIT
MATAAAPLYTPLSLRPPNREIQRWKRQLQEPLSSCPTCSGSSSHLMLQAGRVAIQE